MRTARQTGKTITTWVSDRESWFVLLAVPLLLLPEFLAPLLPLAAAMLGFLVLCRLLLRRALRFGHPIDLAIAILLIMLPISVWVSSDPARSLPKLTTSLGGLFLFWSLATGLQQKRDLPSAGVVLALAAGALALLGLIGTEWPESKVLYLARVYDLLPALVSGIPRSIRGGFHPNEVGGSLAMLVPFVCAILVMVGVRRGQEPASWPGDVLLPSWLRRRLPGFLWGRAVSLCLLAVILVAVLFVLLLTQSRGAFVGLGIGLAAMLVLRDRRMIVVLLVLAVGLVAWDVARGGRIEQLAASITGGGAESPSGRLSSVLATADELTKVGASSSATATGRVEMWRNALTAISDYPLTGVGLYTFQAVSWANYVYHDVSPTFQMNHAHNTYLETGVDFGVFGLLAFLAIVVVVLAKGIRLATTAPTRGVQWLASGLVGGLAANLAHGLVDSALPLGHKPGVIFWCMAGLILAADRLCAAPVAHAATKPQRVQRRLFVLSAAAAILIVLWSVVAGPLLPIVRLDLGALALDQARLKQGLTVPEKATLLDQAERLLTETLPWKADTVYLRLGIAENERNRPEQARAYWAKTRLALDYLLAQGDTKMALGQTKQAAAYFDHAAAVAPQSSSALYRAGKLKAAQGNSAEALSLLQKALDLDNYSDGQAERGETYAAIADVLRSQKRWSEAVQAYQQAEALSARFIWQRELAMCMYGRDGNGQAAEAYLRQSIQKTPNQVEPYMGLIDVLDAEGRVDEAVDLGRKTIRRFPDASAPLLYLGKVYMDRGQYDDAESMFRQAVALRPRNASVRMWLVRLALQRQQPDAAISVLDEGIRLMPGEVSFYVALGDLQRTTGDLAGARKSYRRALELQPDNSAAQGGLDALP